MIYYKHCRHELLTVGRTEIRVPWNWACSSVTSSFYVLMWSVETSGGEIMTDYVLNWQVAYDAVVNIPLIETSSDWHGSKLEWSALDFPRHGVFIIYDKLTLFTVVIEFYARIDVHILVFPPMFTSGTSRAESVQSSWKIDVVSRFVKHVWSLVTTLITDERGKYLLFQEKSWFVLKCLYR